MCLTQNEVCEVGSKAPEFSDIPDQAGKGVSLNEFKGRYLVIYFYPKDNTPGCTIQACDYSALKKDFTKQGAIVLGVSKDSLESHEKFRKDHKLNFPLLSDPDLKVHKAYGAYGKKMLYGKESVGVIRSKFVIDEKGKIVAGGAVRAKGDAAKSLELIS